MHILIPIGLEKDRLVGMRSDRLPRPDPLRNKIRMGWLLRHVSTGYVDSPDCDQMNTDRTQHGRMDVGLESCDIVH